MCGIQTGADESPFVFWSVEPKVFLLLQFAHVVECVGGVLGVCCICYKHERFLGVYFRSGKPCV